LKTAIEELQRNKDLTEGKYVAEIKEIQTESQCKHLVEIDARANEAIHICAPNSMNRANLVAELSPI
jgi:hypothetical protein